MLHGLLGRCKLGENAYIQKIARYFHLEVEHSAYHLKFLYSTGNTFLY